jgi:hypothetical protein
MKSNIVFLFIFAVICCSFVQASNPKNYAEKRRYEISGHVVVVYKTEDPEIEYRVQQGFPCFPLGYLHLRNVTASFARYEHCLASLQEYKALAPKES